MKKSVFLFLFLLPLIIKGQNLKINEETGLYSKGDVVEIKDLPKEEIFKKSIEWIAINYRSANDVIQLKDEESGKIILKGSFSTTLFFKQGWIFHTLILEFRDNKFRYYFTSFSYYSTGSGEILFEKPMAAKNRILEETENKINDSINSLTNYIIKNKLLDDW